MKIVGYDPTTGKPCEYDDGRSEPILRCFCPCCGYRTLPERNGFDLCPVCFWEDDGQDDADADEVRGGPNSILSLTQARRNFAEFGACEARFVENVRPPNASERAKREGL